MQKVNQTRSAPGIFGGEDGLHQIARNHTKDGRDVYCEWINTPLVAKDGSIVGVTSLAMDVGERMRAEEALRASEARFRRLTAQSPDLIVIYDWEVERIVYTNRDAILGYSWQEISTLADMLAHILPEDRENVYRSWRAMEFAPEGQDSNVTRVSRRLPRMARLNGFAAAKASSPVMHRGCPRNCWRR